MIVVIHVIGIMVIATLILMLYACLLVNRDNRTERKLIQAKELLKEQNEKIKLLESESEEFEKEELENI